MLLRASGQAIELDVQLEGSVGRGDGGVAHGAALARFAEAATRASDDLPEARSVLRAELGRTEPGDARFLEVAATVGIFNGLVRVADATGIPLDPATRAASADFRGALGLDDFAGARDTP
jgi:hypothetical protein